MIASSFKEAIMQMMAEPDAFFILWTDECHWC